MIGTAKELMFYETMKPAWHSGMPITQKRAEKLKANVQRGVVQLETCEKYLPMLGYKMVRKSFLVQAVYQNCDNNYVCNERVALHEVTGVRKWYEGTMTEGQARDIRRRLLFDRPISEELVEQVLVTHGWTKIAPRAILQSIWEKPSNISQRAYTKQDIIECLIMDESEKQLHQRSVKVK